MTQGVKCINPKQGIGWIAKGPNWNIIFFNEKTKLYYPLSSSTWHTKISKNGLLPSNVSWCKISSGNIASLKASEYKMINQASSSYSDKWLSATYWLADEINVPPSLAQLISSTCGLPKSNSIPLKLDYISKNGESENLLSTYRQQSSNIPAAYFNLPSGYSLAKNEVNVLMTPSNKALLDELANDLNSDNAKVNPQLTNLAKTHIN